VKEPPFGAANRLFVANPLVERTDAATMTPAYRMKQNTILTVTSLLSILLLTLHVTDDIVRGISKAEPSNIALVVLTVLLYGTLVLAEQRSGHVIMLLVGLFAAAMPVLHMRGTHYPEIARSPGGFFFVWTLWALGGIGGVTLILSARGLWGLRRPPG
jgi:cytochrome bd-type quinol oxidase subunit 2